MIHILRGKKYYVIESKSAYYCIEIVKWLLQANYVSKPKGVFVGPRKGTITPWTTNVLEIFRNLQIDDIVNITEYTVYEGKYDPMVEDLYTDLTSDSQKVFPGKIVCVKDLDAFNKEKGLALSPQEINYLKTERRLTDCEVFGFAQVNSEHCRHKIFNGNYSINDYFLDLSLFDHIRKTSHNRKIVKSAYKDNVAFFDKKVMEQFAPNNLRLFYTKDVNITLSIKAETHNFPTTVCAFPGAATGSGGEIRDRMGGGTGSIPGVGIAAYLTSYARVSDLPWESLPPRSYLYQDPATILIQASNGASDYGNKYGQPLIAGTTTTYEHQIKNTVWGWDKVVMLAGGVGYANMRDCKKKVPKKGDVIILLGGDNYKIGIGGGAVSSVDTGQVSKKLELNAVQRSNPEMEQRVFRVIRHLVESSNNPIVSIHDHGAGGHFNCLSELLQGCGGVIFMDKLPIGDKTLTPLEIIGNESQERMGIIVKKSAVSRVLKVADRERCPCFVIGVCTGNNRIVFKYDDDRIPIDLDLNFLLGNPPATYINSYIVPTDFSRIEIPDASIETYLSKVLRLTKIASKEWLTHKVDRSVTGLVVQQQTVGPCQLPLSDVAVKALDYTAKQGIAIGIGDRPIPGIIYAKAGARLSVGESLLNLVWAPLEKGLKSVVLSANWMWPFNQSGEKANLYKAVEALGSLCVDLKIPVPTGKDSLSMAQKYDDKTVRSPGTVVVTAAAACNCLDRIVTPDLKTLDDTSIYYVPFQKLPRLYNRFIGSSALAQVYSQLGGEVPDFTDASYFKANFDKLQNLIKQGVILAGHDVSDGGVITALCEMAFAGNCGLGIFSSSRDFLFYEGLGVLIQTRRLAALDFPDYMIVARTNKDGIIRCCGAEMRVDELRRVWQQTSYDMDKIQMNPKVAAEGFENSGKPLASYVFPKRRVFKKSDKKAYAAIIREKGTNGDREMAYALHTAGFTVKDVMTTDIVTRKETLEDVNLIVFCGGFSNSDVLGSARGWAGVFKYNKWANKVLENYYQRNDTLSLGVCNGCQLMALLDIVPGVEMLPNKSEIFESRFLTVNILKSPAVMLQGLEKSTLGVWVAHGEGRFCFKTKESCIALKYSSSKYPQNPNGSQHNAAGVCSQDGRHLAMMPHPERAIFPWQWGYPLYLDGPATPWLYLFSNAKEWIIDKTS